MLPQLLNIIGGKNVRTSALISLATGHASNPEPNTTAMLPSINSPLCATSKSLPASAEKMRAGASTFMLIRLTIVMSGFDAPCVDIAERDDQENRQDDAENALEHRGPARLSR